MALVPGSLPGPGRIFRQLRSFLSEKSVRISLWLRATSGGCQFPFPNRSVALWGSAELIFNNTRSQSARKLTSRMHMRCNGTMRHDKNRMTDIALEPVVLRFRISSSLIKFSGAWFVDWAGILHSCGEQRKASCTQRKEAIFSALYIFLHS